METAGIAFQNAPWWLNHSYVQLKGLYLAEDEAYITNNMVTVSGQGANSSMETHAGDQTLLKVRRMVTSGRVAVMLRNGAKHEVSLPEQANKLTPVDLAYIIAQIDEVSLPMSAEEQIAFLASQNGHVEASLSVVK